MKREAKASFFDLAYILQNAISIPCYYLSFISANSKYIGMSESINYKKMVYAVINDGIKNKKIFKIVELPSNEMDRFLSDRLVLGLPKPCYRGFDKFKANSVLNEIIEGRNKKKRGRR